MTREGGVEVDRPRLHLDHVLIAVEDLEEAAERMQADFGLHALAGGRHPGAGTANMIVPLGREYLELIAVVDPAEAAHNPRSQQVLKALNEHRALAAWAVRCDNLAELSTHLRSRGLRLGELRSGSRRRPDGVLLAWESAEVDAGELAPVIPFFIRWLVADAMHPGRMPARHPCGASGIASLVIGAPDPLSSGALLADVLGGEIQYQVHPARELQLAALWIDAAHRRLEIS